MNDQHEMDEPDVFDGPPRVTNADMPEPPHPVNWNLLTAHELEQEWLALNRWVEWLRNTYALPASVIPPCWHRHPELQWELSALHLPRCPTAKSVDLQFAWQQAVQTPASLHCSVHWSSGSAAATWCRHS